jgi:hypothetical protein
METSYIISLGSLLVGLAGVITGYLIGKRRELGMTEWMQEFRGWSGEVITALVNAQYSAANKNVSASSLEEYIVSISALVDRGRLYLPNQNTEVHGAYKQMAFRGYRNQTLDALVAAVKVLKDPRYASDRYEYLKHLRKIFVSHVILILDPNNFNVKLAKLLDTSYRYIHADSKSKGLLPGRDDPPKTEDLLRQVKAELEQKGVLHK